MRECKTVIKKKQDTKYFWGIISEIMDQNR